MIQPAIPYGTTEPQDFLLRESGLPLDGTGFAVTLEITFSNGDALGSPTPPAVAWLDQAAGTVRVTGVEGLPLGSYHVRFRLTDNGGGFGFYPNGDAPDEWDVVPVP